jgi:thiosulfate sulfurtransferase
MSQAAAAYFSEQGFDEAFSMDGGYSDWELRFPEQTEKS